MPQRSGLSGSHWQTAAARAAKSRKKGTEQVLQELQIAYHTRTCLGHIGYNTVNRLIVNTRNLSPCYSTICRSDSLTSSSTMDTPLLIQIDPLDPQGKSYEERIQMAISMIKQNGFKASGKPKCSFREAVGLFHLSKTTLTERFKGQGTHQEGHKHEQKLDNASQDTLVEWIKECGHRNIPLHPSAVAAHAKAILGVEIGMCWVQHFGKNHPKLQAQWATGMEQCHAQALNPATTSDLFVTTNELIEKYEIEAKNLYNMDEKGCQQGVGGKVHVLVDRDQKYVQQIEDRNRELITAIECICADGSAIQPSVVFKGNRRNLEWGNDNPCNVR